MKSHLCPRACLALDKNLVLHLAELEKFPGKVSEKGKFQSLGSAFLEDLFCHFSALRIPVILRSIVFQKGQTADNITLPAFFCDLFQCLKEEWIHLFSSYKVPVGFKSQISQDHLFPASLADIFLQHCHPLGRIAPGKHTVHQDLFFQLITVHSKAHSPFPQFQGFLHRTFKMFHQIS